MSSSDFWIELAKDYPELVEVTTKAGKSVLKIITRKLKEKYSEIKEWASSKKLETTLPLLRASETKSYLELESISLEKKYSLLKKYLTQEDWSSFMLGIKAKEAKAAINMKYVKDIKKQAQTIHGQRGVKIINFVLQSYFDELILPLLEHQVKNMKTDSEIFQWFGEFMDNAIRFFPRAFWVKNSTTDLEIRMALIKRCVSNNFKNVNIHTINSENISKVEKVLKEFASDESFPNFNYEISDDIKKIFAVTFKIKIE
jgi:hypothetical protein